MDLLRIAVVGIFLLFSYFYLSRCFLIMLHPKRKWPIYLIVAVFMFVTNIGFWGSRYFRGQGIIPDSFSSIYWVSFTALGLMFFLLSCFFISDVLAFTVYFFGKFSQKSKQKKQSSIKNINNDRRSFLHILSFGIATVFTGVSFLNARKTPPVKEVIVQIKNLHPSLKDLSIVQISDLHVGQTISKKYVEDVVVQINSLSPDLIVITGDLVDGFVDQIQEWVKPLGDLKAKYGVYYVTGNHEYYWDAKGWIAFMQTLGIHYLGNSHQLINVEKAQVVLAGINDLSAHKFDVSHKMDPEKSILNAPTSPHLKILLAHQPNSAFTAEKLKYFDLQISGHTHGGQMWPMTWLIHLIQPFKPGLTFYESMFVYVSRGTGYWGPPARLGSDSEITLLKIKQA